MIVPSSWSDTVDEITEKLIYGQKILIRALPRSGRSTLLEAVAKRYTEVSGRAPILVRYGDGQTPEAVAEQLTAEATATSSAVLLVDDWGDFLRRSPNVAWQPKLNSLCVDGSFAKAVGVALTAISGENLSRTLVGGSPLVDAVHEVRGMPVPATDLVVAELQKHGLNGGAARDLAELFGGHHDLLRAAQRGDPTPQVRRSVFQIAARLGHDSAARILDLGRKPGLHLARQPMDEFLVPAVYAPTDGRTALVPALLEAGLIELLPGAGDSWPVKRDLSADRLLARLLAGQEAFWFDRYLYAALPELLGTLASVTASASADLTLRLLSGPPQHPVGPADAERVVAAFRRFRDRGTIIHWHQVAYGDIHPMHDRQLLFRSSIDGYHLPPADRIVGKVLPGNENDAYLARAPLGRMESAWRRSSCWACVQNGQHH